MKAYRLEPRVFNALSACAFAAGCTVLAGPAGAVTTAGRASATVVDSASIIINMSALSGTIFTIQGLTGSLSPSGPLLRVGVSPPLSETGADRQSSAANSAVLNVTLNADGSLAVSGGSGLTFAVSQPAGGPIRIEYN